ncbi:molybdenum cofactor guanylyltransferase MobA [Candidatus Spongiihabitans sp.]|uniref:molybdenum cofactor guanylyltransferase MobA n=1 Tax=Candidatus Spongiihabitans sp. TaxID=3101308 RepID=UPI003C7BBF5B
MGNRQGDAICEVTGLILAGGLARRMGGQDKGLILFRGEAMAQRIARALRPQCHHILINANRNISEYEKFGYPVISDQLTDFQGPLAGMLTGLNTISTPWMVTAPCDGPFMASDYVKKMKRAVALNNHAIAVAACASRLQPVYAMIHQSLMTSLGAFLGGNERKIDKWYGQHDYTIVDFSDAAHMFENINTPQQLRALEQLDQSADGSLD